MMSADDELMLRAALDDLTSDQPPAPASRYTSIRRKAAGRRRHQRITAAAAVLAAAAVVFGLVQLPRILRSPPAARPVPSWALRWPDHRDGSVPQPVLNWAVQTWWFRKLPYAWMLTPHEASVFRPKLPAVIWYVGQTVVGGNVVVVMFEADHRLVVGWADASRVLGGAFAQCTSLSRPPEPCPGDPWTLTSVPAPRPGTAGLTVGLNVHRPYNAARPYIAAHEYFGRRADPANWIVLLDSPGVRRVTWRTATAAGPVVGAAAASSGLAVADTGHIRAPVQLTGLLTSAGNTLAEPEYVGIPGNGAGIPQLALPPPIRASGAFLLFTGQGDQLDQAPAYDLALPQDRPRTGRTADGTPKVSWHAPAGGPGPGAGTYALTGSCYGPAPLQVSVLGHLVGTMKCDNQRQVLNVRIKTDVFGASELWFTVSTSMLTRWQLHFG
jgi:hypothetical protein